MKILQVIFRITLVFFLFFVILPGYSQRKKVTTCGYIIPPKQKKLVTNFQSVYEAANIVKEMLNTINWQENFRLREQNGMQNAYATIINNARWIVYDNDFLEDIDAFTKTKWASISIMAHEVGHHYYNHVVSNTGSTIPKELEADAFSGYVMAMLGATKEQSVAAITAIASDRASSTHPGKADRVNAISLGWDKALTVSTDKKPPVINPTTPSTPAPSQTPTERQPGPHPAPAPAPPQTDPATDPSWIALYMNSNKNETVYLSDDGRNYQPAEIKAGHPFVFKFEIYNYGWLRLKYYNGYRIFKLNHGSDYIIVWNRRNGNWSVSKIPD